MQVTVVISAYDKRTRHYEIETVVLEVEEFTKDSVEQAIAEWHTDIMYRVYPIAAAQGVGYYLLF